MISEVYGKAFDAELSGLAGLLQGKNYFVISQATNEAITRVNWRDGRLVMVCGSSLKKQCAFACEGSEPQKLSEEERMRLKAACREFVNAITVKERPSKMTLSSTKMTLTAGKSKSLTLSGTAKGSIQWTSRQRLRSFVQTVLSLLPLHPDLLCCLAFA